MLGVKMKTDSRAFVAYLREHGLLTVAAGDNVVRVLPPLVIEEAHIAEFVERLSRGGARTTRCRRRRDRHRPFPGRQGRELNLLLALPHRRHGF